MSTPQTEATSKIILMTCISISCILFWFHPKSGNRRFDVGLRTSSCPLQGPALDLRKFLCPWISKRRNRGTWAIYCYTSLSYRLRCLRTTALGQAVITSFSHQWGYYVLCLWSRTCKNSTEEIWELRSAPHLSNNLSMTNPWRCSSQIAFHCLLEHEQHREWSSRVPTAIHKFLMII